MAKDEERFKGVAEFVSSNKFMMKQYATDNYFINTHANDIY